MASESSVVLVTGGAGYIGSRTCRALKRIGLVPVTYDNLIRGHRDSVRWGPLVEGDILDGARLRETIKAYSPTACIHFAALSYVAESISDPVAYHMNNVAGSIVLFDALIEGDVRKIVFSSSCATYGEVEEQPISESAPQLPVTPYGRTKLMVEQILKDFDATSALRSVSLRYFNACGAHEDGSLGEAHEPETHLIPRAILAAAGRNPVLEITGTDYPTRDGTAVRDFIHITDIAEAHVLALKYLLSGGPTDCFNIGVGRGYTVREVLKSVERVGGVPVPVTLAPRRVGDPPELVADARRAAAILGFAPVYRDLDAMIETAWRWHIDPLSPVNATVPARHTDYAR
jgi:UDP-arabinose 4-epimerase